MKKDKMNKSRRTFLKLGIIAGAGLTLGAYFTWGGEEVKSGEKVWENASRAWTPNAWLRVDEQGLVTVRVNHSEMGQGILTSLAMIAAEELEADWEKVRAEVAPAESVYKNPEFNTQMTASSNSVRSSWDALRKAGAAAREMLTAAGALSWNALQKDCRAENGRVIHIPTGKSLGYGELTSVAARVPVPDDPPLKKTGDYRIIGRDVHRLDIPVKTEGRAVFGLDVRIDGMVTAAMVHSPVPVGTAVSIDDGRAYKVMGVRNVVNLGSSVAVVADAAWAALEGSRMLDVTWDPAEAPEMDTSLLRKKWPTLLKHKGKKVFEKGEPEKRFTGSDRSFRASYFLPYQGHAVPEPMNCTAHVQKNRCDVWAPTQNQDAAQEEAARLTGLPYRNVYVHTTFLGGGFGRRIAVDYVTEAVTLSKKLGVPVQTIWSREEDMRHDLYRPASFNELRAELDERGRAIAWHHRIVGPDHMSFMLPKLIPGMLPYRVPRAARNMASSLADFILPRAAAGKKASEGAGPLPYDIGHVLVDYVKDDPGIPLGFWRSVSHSQNAFAVECFMDELAHYANRDPVEYRLDLLRDNPAMARVLELVAEKGGWGAARAAGTGLGIAVHNFHDTLLAFTAEVSVSPKGQVKVHRVVCALDCGIAVHPKNIAVQIRSGVVFGLAAVLNGCINVDKGRVREGNFDDFPLVRMDEAPRVDVHIVPSHRPPTGIGEAAVPLIAPALCNAVFAASGVRVRDLPIDRRLLTSRA